MLLKVLLVDDDYLVRMYLRQLIDWEAEGCLLLADVCNGEEAVRLMEREEPHVVITDLSMPVMDGIALIRHLKERHSAARIAVLSCHDEFAYVREAMKLGADEYVLKNVLDAAGLRALLATLRKGLVDKAEEARQSEQLRFLAQKGSEAQQRDALRQLRREELPFAQQAALLQSHGISGDYYQCAALELHLQRAEQMTTAFQVCAQCLRERTAVCAVVEERTLCVLVGFPGVSSAQVRHEALYQLGLELQERLREYANERPDIGFSQVIWGDGNASRAMAQAAEAALHCFYGEALCDYSRVPPMAQRLPADAARVGQRPERYDAALAAAVVRACRESRVRPALVLEWMAELDRGLLPAAAPPPETFAACEERLARYKAIGENASRDQTHRTDNLAVSNAAAYVRAHFAQPLQLHQVAEEVGLNAAYLSHLFKKETGIGFSEYLQNCRLGYVRQQLAETEESIKAIAAAGGFLDYQSFCKLFKKQCGLRPADFRRESKKNTKF